MAYLSKASTRRLTRHPSTQYALDLAIKEHGSAQGMHVERFKKYQQRLKNASKPKKPRAPRKMNRYSSVRSRAGARWYGCGQCADCRAGKGIHQSWLDRPWDYESEDYEEDDRPYDEYDDYDDDDEPEGCAVM